MKILQHYGVNIRRGGTRWCKGFWNFSPPFKDRLEWRNRIRMADSKIVGTRLLIMTMIALISYFSYWEKVVRGFYGDFALILEDKSCHVLPKSYICVCVVLSVCMYVHGFIYHNTNWQCISHDFLFYCLLVVYGTLLLKLLLLLINWTTCHLVSKHYHLFALFPSQCLYLETVL